MGTGAEFVAADALLADAAIEAAVYEAGAGFLGTGGAALTEAGIGAGIGDFAIGADLFGTGAELASNASSLGLSPTEYTEAINSMGADPTGLEAGDFVDGNNVLPQGTEESWGSNPRDTRYDWSQDYGQNPTNSAPTLDQAPQTTLDSQGTNNFGATQGTGAMDMAGSTGTGIPGSTGPKSLWEMGKDIIKSPQYQIGKTGIDLYSQFQDSQAAKAGLNRFNQLNDRGAWANQSAQDLYNNPNAFFNSPAFKQSQAGAMEGYRRQQAARGRRADTAGLALQMQKYGTDQFNNYSAGLSRYNQQPNLNGLQGLYQGAGKGTSNLLNTFAKKDLWDSLG
jgi:hypothetical protein